MSTDISDRILDATERLLGRYGYGKMSVEDVAREAGLARRTVYLHFANKEEIALCSIDRVVDRMLAELTAIACCDDEPEERLRRMLVTRVMSRFDSVRDYHQSFHDLFAALRPAYLARRERYFAAEAAVFAGLLEEGRRLGAFRVEDPPVTARVLLVATNALLPYSLSPRELGAREDVHAQAEAVADLALNGLRRLPRQEAPAA